MTFSMRGGGGGGHDLASDWGIAWAGRSILNTFVFLRQSLANQGNIQWPGQNQNGRLVCNSV